MTPECSSLNRDEAEAAIFSSLIYEKSIRKDDPVFDLLGTLDELAASLGVCSSLMDVCDHDSGVVQAQTELIDHIQEVLRNISASVASEKIIKGVSEEVITRLKSYRPTCEVPKGFCRLGTNACSAQLHVARTICRRAERCLVAYIYSSCFRDAEVPVLEFMDKLSYLLWVFASEHQ